MWSVTLRKAVCCALGAAVASGAWAQSDRGVSLQGAYGVLRYQGGSGNITFTTGGLSPYRRTVAYPEQVWLDPYSPGSKIIVPNTTSFGVRTHTSHLRRHVEMSTRNWDIYPERRLATATRQWVPIYCPGDYGSRAPDNFTDPTLNIDYYPDRFRVSAYEARRLDPRPVETVCDALVGSDPYLAAHSRGCGCATCITPVRVTGISYGTGYRSGYDATQVRTYTRSSPPAQPVVVVERTAAEHARAYHRAGELQDAVTWYRRALAEGGDELLRRDLAVALIEAGDVRGGVAALAEAHRRDPLLADLPLDPTLFGEGSRRWRATVNRATVYARSARSGDAWLATALLLENEGRPDAALRALDHAAQAGLEPALTRAVAEAMRGR